VARLLEMSEWPGSCDALIAAQRLLRAEWPPPWVPAGAPRIGGCFVCFARGGSGPGAAGDPAWAACALGEATQVVTGAAGAAFEAGLLAPREGPLLEAAVRALGEEPDVLLVDATGRDHPRRAGLAVHLGAVLELPTVGVTHRPLVVSARPSRCGGRGRRRGAPARLNGLAEEAGRGRGSCVRVDPDVCGLRARHARGWKRRERRGAEIEE